MRTKLSKTLPGIGRRTMQLNARQVFYEENSQSTILLAIEDITERRARERDLNELMDKRNCCCR